MSDIAQLIIAAYTTFELLIFGLVCYFIRARPWKWFVLLPMLAGIIALAVIPILEERQIDEQFAEFCKGAGVHVIRKVETEGYYDSTTTGWSTPQVVNDKKLIAEYEKRGFRFLERNAASKPGEPQRISHLEKGKDGLWRITILNKPLAKYHYKNAYRLIPFREEEVVSWKILKREMIVVDEMSGEVIGRNLQFQRHPGWIDARSLGLFGSMVTRCPNSKDRQNQPEFPEAVFKPKA